MVGHDPKKPLKNVLHYDFEATIEIIPNPKCYCGDELVCRNTLCPHTNNKHVVNLAMWSYVEKPKGYENMLKLVLLLRWKITYFHALMSSNFVMLF
jgi:hypothetical protein